MALCLGQCDDMLAAAASNNVKLMVRQPQHFYGTCLKAKEILDSDDLRSLITAVSCMSKESGFSRRIVAAIAFVRYKSGLAGITVSIGYNDGAPN